jgi:hypothetical protein
VDAALAGVLIAAIGPTGVAGGIAAFRQLRGDKHEEPIPPPKQVEVADESAAALRAVLSELVELRAQVDRCPVPDCPVRSMRYRDPTIQKDPS